MLRYMFNCCTYLLSFWILCEMIGPADRPFYKVLHQLIPRGFYEHLLHTHAHIHWNTQLPPFFTVEWPLPPARVLLSWDLKGWRCLWKCLPASTVVTANMFIIKLSGDKNGLCVCSSVVFDTYWWNVCIQRARGLEWTFRVSLCSSCDSYYYQSHHQWTNTLML